MGTTSYGIWLTNYFEAREVFSEDEAQRRHNDGADYHVWWGDQAAPALLMRVRPRSIGIVDVLWLDGHSRWTMNHLFVPEDTSQPDAPGGRLFLSQVRNRALPEFDPEDPDASGNAMVSFFKRDGSAHHERVVDGVFETMDTPALPHHEAEHLLFEPRPAFGDWARITRPDRDK